MAASSVSSLPQPPADLASRRLPIKRIDAILFRIHRSAHSSLYFNKDGSGRFDDETGKYGVLYTALNPEAAFAEVFLRELSLILIPESALENRSLCEIVCKRVDCVDLTGAGLRRLGCDNRISTEIPYGTTARWSRGLFEHPQQPGGIIYLSRHNPRFKCIALFDRCQSQLKEKSSAGLMTGSRRAWTVEQITRYDLAIEPLV
jgi:hypothetical protein